MILFVECARITLEKSFNARKSPNFIFIAFYEGKVTCTYTNYEKEGQTNDGHSHKEAVPDNDDKPKPYHNLNRHIKNFPVLSLFIVPANEEAGYFDWLVNSNSKAPDPIKVNGNINEERYSVQVYLIAKVHIDSQHVRQKNFGRNDAYIS